MNAEMEMCFSHRILCRINKGFIFLYCCYHLQLFLTDMELQGEVSEMLTDAEACKCLLTLKWSINCRSYIHITFEIYPVTQRLNGNGNSSLSVLYDLALACILISFIWYFPQGLVHLWGKQWWYPLGRKGRWVTTLILLSSFYHLNATLSNMCRNFTVSIQPRHWNISTKEMPASAFSTHHFVRGKNVPCYTTDHSNHLTSPQCLCIRWRTGGAGWGAEQWESDVRFLPGPGSKFRPA